MVFYPQQDISTHTLTWSVTLAWLFALFAWQISTHTLTWSVTVNVAVVGGVGSHFNSHAHVERDIFVAAYFGFMIISTHTLTWSVTFWELGILNAKKISTHTLTWSVTKWTCLIALII